ncbi:MAG: LacI family DNA-binding transcriptional regulator [Chloroflexi bacterium]|nr:LacI family DNA-binding transcriptional regulator [Chloroflexota bacterium]
MAAKLEDVARQAGVSTASVSRVLANKPYVSEAVRQRVLTAIEALNFHPAVWRAVYVRNIRK